MTEGYDVRPETEEQALSLGATFVKTGVDARGKGGYARELTADEKTKVARRADQTHPVGSISSSLRPPFPAGHLPS